MICCPAHRVRSSRTGSVALLLVLLLAVMIGSAAIGMARTEVAHQRADRQANQVALLDAAIDAVRQSDIAQKQVIRLPIDPERDHWIDVQWTSSDDATGTSPQIISASERKGERVLLTITRPSGVTP